MAGKGGKVIMITRRLVSKIQGTEYKLGVGRGPTRGRIGRGKGSYLVEGNEATFIMRASL